MMDVPNLVNLPMKAVSELSKILEDEYGLKPAVPAEMQTDYLIRRGPDMFSPTLYDGYGTPVEGPRRINFKKVAQRRKKNKNPKTHRRKRR